MGPVGSDDWKKRLKALGIARRRRPKRTEDFLRREEGKSEILPGSLRTLRKVQSGRDGEDRAAVLLEENSLRILARNVRYPDGEIDIVADDRGTTVFVEVKRRRTAALGAPAEAVTRTKRARIVRAARRWLAARPGRARAVRFDVVAIVDEPPSVTWLKDAFGRDAGA